MPILSAGRSRADDFALDSSFAAGIRNHVRRARSAPSRLGGRSILHIQNHDDAPDVIAGRGRTAMALAGP